MLSLRCQQILRFLTSRVGKNPTTHLKNPTHLGFFGFFGFYWVLLGFLGFIGFNWVLLGFLHLMDLKLAFLTNKSLLLHGYSLFVIKKCIFTKSLHYIKPIRDQQKGLRLQEVPSEYESSDSLSSRNVVCKTIFLVNL